jgi:hypothetical protein
MSVLKTIKLDEEDQQYVYFVAENDSVNPAAVAFEPHIVTTSDDGRLDEDIDGLGETLWTKCNNALRDLLVFLVDRHGIEEVMDSKVKAQRWEKLISEFNVYTRGQVVVSRPQIVRKWHNWKQYNKSKKKAHPFSVVGKLDENMVKEKCQRLVEKLESESLTDSLLLPIAGDDKGPSTSTEATVTFRPPLSRLTKMRRRDFLVRRTGASASVLSVKRLEHEIVMESLHLEQERWKIRADNQLLVKDKLKKKVELADLRIEKARLDLELLKNECQSKGIST